MVFLPCPNPFWQYVVGGGLWGNHWEAVLCPAQRRVLPKPRGSQVLCAWGKTFCVSYLAQGLPGLFAVLAEIPPL